MLDGQRGWQGNLREPHLGLAYRHVADVSRSSYLGASLLPRALPTSCLPRGLQAENSRKVENSGFLQETRVGSLRSPDGSSGGQKEKQLEKEAGSTGAEAGQGQSQRPPPATLPG